MNCLLTFLSFFVLVSTEAALDKDGKKAENGLKMEGNGDTGNLTDSEIFGDWKKCMEIFDADGNSEVRMNEFKTLCSKLFVNEEGKPYPLEDSVIEKLFKTFDRDGNDFICKKEFPVMHAEWIKKIVNPVSVLVVVDVQNDFIDGSLALRNTPSAQEGSDVIDPINKMQETIHFRQVIYSQDWHPDNHISFIDNVHLRQLDDSSPVKNSSEAKVYDTVVFKLDSGKTVQQKLWPRHCVQNTSGAEFHEKLNILPGSVVVLKGMNPDVDSYSAFLDNDKMSLTKLKEHVDAVGATDVYVCGLAYDICVGATALDSLALGYRTVLVEDSSRGVDEAGISKTRKDVEGGNGVVVGSEKVKQMVEGVDRPPQLGVHLADQLKKKWEKITLE